MEPVSVLVVDDEPGIALLCKRVLTRIGYLVTALTDPREAMEWLAKNKADLLLVDIRMPGVDGFEVIARAKSLQPDLAVLVMTGFGTVETAIRALRQGVDGLLLKPFEKGEELVQAARQALADSQQKRDAARVHALRPLFEVTESLLSETHTGSLLELVVRAIVGHLHCNHAAYYQYSTEEGRFVLLAGQGKGLPDFIIQVDASGAPMLVNASGPGDPSSQNRLRKAGVGAAMFIPVSRQRFRGVFFAGRDPEQPGFEEGEMDLFQILSRQAAAAIENARLYDEERSYVRKIEESQNALLQAEKMAAAGRLSASIAHEVNNPLQSVQNCLHLAGRDDVPEAKRREYFEMARSEVERLSLTVQRMLDFYRPGASKPERIQIAPLLEYIINLTQKQLTERGIRIAAQVPADLAPINAVSSQIQQVFINLILNSYDAMPEGGDLSITARSASGGVEMLFRDSGPGVPRDDQTRVFDPFFSTKEGGTGLGLTVSYNILMAHGGALELLQDGGKGACFRVFLPAGDAS
jgi:signal transduction histidine kinase/CheY-like chemotaxis protein